MEVSIEPRPDRDQRRQTGTVTDNRRPDLRLIGYYGVTLIDVAVVHPAAATYRVQASRTALHAARQRERIKTNKYSQLARDEGATFIPCVFESFGSFTPTVKRIIAVITREATHFHSDDYTAAFYRDSIDRICAAVQTGNARAAAEADRLSR